MATIGAMATELKDRKPDRETGVYGKIVKCSVQDCCQGDNSDDFTIRGCGA